MNMLPVILMTLLLTIRLQSSSANQPTVVHRQCYGTFQPLSLSILYIEHKFKLDISIIFLIKVEQLNERSSQSNKTQGGYVDCLLATTQLVEV